MDKQSKAVPVNKTEPPATVFDTIEMKIKTSHVVENWESICKIKMTIVRNVVRTYIKLFLIE